MSDYMDDYTSRRRTRVYRRDEEETAAPANLIGQTQAIQPQKPKLFDGISAAQVIAGAAAAATSVALASYIGVAGSIIGAAVSSVVTVISSQLYRRFLDESARKLKNANIKSITNALHEQREDATVNLGGKAVRGARIAPSELREKAAAERAATQRKVIAFSVVAAVAAVVVVTGAILLGTAGEGIGEKTPPLIPQVHEAVQQGAEPESVPPADTATDADAAAEPSVDTETPAEGGNTSADSSTAGSTTTDTVGSSTSTGAGTSGDSSQSSGATTDSDGSATGADQSGTSSDSSSSTGSGAGTGASGTSDTDSSTSTGASDATNSSAA